LTILTAKKLL